MSALPPEKTYSETDPIAAAAHMMANASGARSASATEGGQEENQIQMLNLQWWICELLIKNQQLRVKLAWETKDDQAIENEVSLREMSSVSGPLET
jgi:hypothetical protein